MVQTSRNQSERSEWENINLKGFNLCYMYKQNKIKYSQNLVVYLVTKLYTRGEMSLQMKMHS